MNGSKMSKMQFLDAKFAISLLLTDVKDKVLLCHQLKPESVFQCCKPCDKECQDLENSYNDFKCEQAGGKA